MRDWYLQIISSVLIILVESVSSVSKPNIVFILADDLGWGSGGFGARTDSDLSFATPNLNKLALSGIKMTQYYSMEVCTPARASLMTGRYPLSMGMQFGTIEATSTWGLNMSETTIAEVLRSTGGYTNYQVGKWNLGHFSDKLLPTARGFDYFMGYNSGSLYPWSKRDTSSSTKKRSGKKVYFKDLIYGDGSCYSMYEGSDMHDYSTFLFRDKAVNVITFHNYEAAPLFLYLATQAVHDPFEDAAYPSGVPKKYLPNPAMSGVIKSSVTGRKRRQYATSLYLLDSAIQDVVDAVTDVGQDHNTYFIIASDNGGCYDAGGRNGPLRGNKGTLFEGGTRVDALLYSKMLSFHQRGASYSGLMHVSDWFPTILDMAGLSFTPASGYELDGVSHWSNIKSLNVSDSTQSLTSPRSVMLYNYYVNIENFSGWEGIRAVRDSQYKLIQTNDNSISGWFWPETAQDDDDDLDSLGSCVQSLSFSKGTYTSYLFDIVADPYEENNLWGLEAYSAKQVELLAHFQIFAKKSKTDTLTYAENHKCYASFKFANNYIVPWEKASDSGEGVPTFSKNGCDYSYVSPDDDDDSTTIVDTDPTLQPTVKPSSSNTVESTASPVLYNRLRQ